jgi:hypothetical protein
MRNPDFGHPSIRELLTTFSEVLERLRERGVVRSSNNPVADYCEALVARALKLERLGRSNKGCDAVDPVSKKRYEIKGRRITKHNSSTQLSVIRALDHRHFDYLVGVLFDENFTVTHAHCIPFEVVESSADYREGVNGWIIHLRPSLWENSEVSDITAEVQKAQMDWA